MQSTPKVQYVCMYVRHTDAGKQYYRYTIYKLFVVRGIHTLFIEVKTFFLIFFYIEV